LIVVSNTIHQTDRDRQTAEQSTVEMHIHTCIHAGTKLMIASMLAYVFIVIIVFIIIIIIFIITIFIIIFVNLVHTCCYAQTEISKLH